MAYSYDRRLRVASNRQQILSLIVQKALHERNVASLVNAYIDEMEEEWVESHDVDDGPPDDASTVEHDKWLTKVFGLLHDEDDVEKAMSEAYVSAYRRAVNHPISRESALEVFLFPHPGFPIKRVPKEVASAVATALARRDAAEANQMRDMALARRP